MVAKDLVVERVMWIRPHLITNGAHNNHMSFINCSCSCRTAGSDTGAFAQALATAGRQTFDGVQFSICPARHGTARPSRHGTARPEEEYKGSAAEPIAPILAPLVMRGQQKTHPCLARIRLTCISECEHHHGAEERLQKLSDSHCARQSR